MALQADENVSCEGCRSWCMGSVWSPQWLPGAAVPFVFRESRLASCAHHLEAMTTNIKDWEFGFAGTQESWTWVCGRRA